MQKMHFTLHKPLFSGSNLLQKTFFRSFFSGTFQVISLIAVLSYNPCKHTKV